MTHCIAASFLFILRIGIGVHGITVVQQAEDVVLILDLEAGVRRFVRVDVLAVRQIVVHGDLVLRQGLAARADYSPRQLSGGQQQRVAIARALAADPEIIYFDEPTSALDPELTGEVLSVMRQLAEEGMTMLVVTHEMGFARNVSSKTVFMENGVVVEQAPSQQFFASPKEERTRAFLRRIAHTE